MSLVKHSLLFILMLAAQLHNAQNPLYWYDFDDCTYTEGGGTLSDLGVQGNPSCVCGPQDTAISFNGMNDALSMPVPGNLLTNDYTFCFYMKPGNGTFAEQVFSNARSCNDRDSLFSIQYFPTVKTLSVRLSDIGATQAAVEGELDAGRCWHHIALVKKGRIIQLFINGVRDGQFEGNQPVNIESTAPIRIASTLCSVGQNIVPYQGEIDQIEWYDRALSPTEINNIIIEMDKSITGDTLIFKGATFVPTMSRTCANSLLWSPGVGLSSTVVLRPLINLPQTQKYRISFDYNGCTALDSMTVTVIDSDKIECENLLLPSAFTPNGDGLNDHYGISNDFIIDQLSGFEILDRNGNSLFETSIAGEKWNGEYRGKKMPPGSYFYRIVYTCKDDEYAKAGSFSIMR